MNLNDLRMSLKAALDNMWARIDARITAIEQGGGGGGVTSVNGQTGDVSITPANIGAVDKTTSDTMAGDLTLSANGGTVKLHPYWDNVEGQSLGFYINAKNGGALNAIFLPLIADNAGGHNICLLSDLEPVKVTQGGTGAITAAGARTNLNVPYGARGETFDSFALLPSEEGSYNVVYSGTDTNAPSQISAPWWWNVIQIGISTRLTQIAFCPFRDRDCLFIRQNHDGTWYGWYKFQGTAV